MYRARYSSPASQAHPAPPALHALPAGSMAQLTLWSGRSAVLPAVLNYIAQESWPARSTFYWAVSDEMSARELSLLLVPAAMLLMEHGHAVHFWQLPGARDHDNAKATRHHHVAALYRDAFRRAVADAEWLLTLEDDNLPQPGALARLAQGMTAPDIAGIAAVYRIRGAPMFLNCSTTAGERWTPVPAHQCPAGLFPTPFTGGGLTLYRAEAIRRATPVQCRELVDSTDGTPYVEGWDGHLGREFLRLGYRLLSDGGLWIGHHTPEIMNHLAATGETL